MQKRDYPQIHYFDQDFVDIYDRSWAWMGDFWRKGGINSPFQSPGYIYKDSEEIDLYESCLASFFLVYFNRKYAVHAMLDNFYRVQEASGAIRRKYNAQTGEPILDETNPEGLAPPLLAWAEYNLYHKVGVKKRVQEIMPNVMAHHDWIENNFKQANGLYAPPPATRDMMENSPSYHATYPMDFNIFVAINALNLASLADILNDKELNFRYKKQYFSLKTRINSLMWNPKDRIYYDLDENEKQIRVKIVSAFLTLLARIPNEEKAQALFEHLGNPESFGTENPFPSLAANEKKFDEEGCGACGAVFPSYTYMLTKGLEKYQMYSLARESAIQHIYNILDTFNPGNKKHGTLWQAYKPKKEGPAIWKEKPDWNKPLNIAYTGLSTIALMIENVLGLYISLPRKTVDWFIPTMELMGVEALALKRNWITIVSNKSNHGWEIRLESEKLYYFSIHLTGEGKKKTLPIPSGKCSMLINKL